ncbi:MAG: heavy metal translocating P-type ATPase [bacterium]|nr:heavy metal translocating P-type ATPase [bacterium]
MMTSSLKQRSFPVLEMSCAACAVSVESILKHTSGVKNASVNYANQSALVEWDASAINEQGLKSTVQSIGYDLLITEENAQTLQEEAKERTFQKLKKQTLWSAILSTPIVILGMFFMHLPSSNYISMALATIVVFYFGRHFYVSAWKKLQHGTATMDTLVALSTSIAYIFSVFNTFYPQFWTNKGLQAHVYFEAAAVIIVFISIGKLLEENAKSNTSSAIKKLMGLQANTVMIFENNQEKEIPIADVKLNDLILVKPGEKIAVDGKITEGSSFVNESMISGEPIPVEKKSGDAVFAGTINQKGSFKFTAEKIGSETLLARIISMVQKAQGSKAPVQKLVDKIAGIFVPTVIGLALLTFIIWYFFGGENGFTYALLNSITVLVIACPCALGLATPTAIMVGVGKGAENNILIKDSESLEIAHKVNALILDKTGTITEGKPDVQDIQWLPGKETPELKQILMSMEARSEHPLAAAIVKKLSADTLSTLSLTNFESLTGMGVQANLKENTYYVGNENLLQKFKIEVGPVLAATLTNWKNNAYTLVFFSDASEVLAMIAITDKIKPTSKAAIAQLMERGIAVYMLTGDNAQSAKAVADEVGIKNYQAHAMPSDKSALVRQLQTEGKTVAMVGDGINDSEALAQANISIAMGKGSDIAMDVASITLMTSDLQAIPKAFTLSKHIVNGIHQNLFWAFIYNLIGIPIAAGILYPINGFLLNPMIAGAAMALSSVSVVSNSLRLKSKKL